MRRFISVCFALFAGTVALASISENFDGVTAPALPSGWNFDANYVTSTTQAKSGVNSLAFTLTSVNNAFNTTADTNSGNVVVSAWIRSNAPGTTCGVTLIARSSSSVVANWSTTTAYRSGMSFGSTPAATLSLYRRVSGTDTPLITITPGTLALSADAWYYLEFTVQTVGSNVVLSSSVQRASDSQWMQSGGAGWQSAKTVALTFTDSTAPITGTGFVGIREQAQTGSTNFLDDYKMTEIAPGPVTSLSTGAITTSSIALSWTAPASGTTTTDYLVEYRLNPAGSWTTFVDGVSTATTTTVTGLSNATAYDFRVSAINTNGFTGTASNIATGTTGTPAVTRAFCE